MGRLLRKLATEARTFVLVSHDVNLAAEFSDRALLLVKGSKAAEGAIANVLTDEHFKRAYPDADISVGKNPFTGAPKLFFSAKK